MKVEDLDGWQLVEGAGEYLGEALALGDVDLDEFGVGGKGVGVDAEPVRFAAVDGQVLEVDQRFHVRSLDLGDLVGSGNHHFKMVEALETTPTGNVRQVVVAYVQILEATVEASGEYHLKTSVLI